MIQPADFLDSADSCLRENTNHPHEVHVRSTISRAYYAAFHYAKATAKQYNIHVEPPAEHAGLIKALQNHQDKRLVTAGNRLRSLRDKRTRADYRLDNNLQRSEAVAALKTARILISDFT